MKQELSILIPIYNACCTPLVEQLHDQASSIDGLRFEIIVADDGSTHDDSIAMNEPINQLENCRYIVRKENCGRAVIRNFLAQQAHYEWLLFIDGDMSVINQNFIADYLHCDAQEVIYGGYKVGNGEKANLRYCYEKEAESRHTADHRRQQPYRDFHTSNFMIQRNLMLANPLDERFRRYGYEDVLFGKQLKKAGISICHIENPVGFNSFEKNERFVEKTEEGLQTLYEFRRDLRGYNSLLTFTDGIHLESVKGLIRLWHRLFGPLERLNLISRHPSLYIFNLYKIGFYLTLTKKRLRQ